MTEKTKRGGARPGSGRKTDAPVRGTKMMSFRLDIDLVDFLEKQENKGRFINGLIRKEMNK